MLGPGWGIKSEPGDEMSAVCSPYHLSAAFQHPDPGSGQTRRNDRCKNRGRLEKKYKIQNIWVPISQANCILLLFLLWVSVGHDCSEFARTSHNLRFEMLPSPTCVILIFETIFSIHHRDLYVFPIHARSLELSWLTSSPLNLCYLLEESNYVAF